MIKIVGGAALLIGYLYSTSGPIVLDGPPIVVVDATGKPAKHHPRQYSVFPPPQALVASR